MRDDLVESILAHLARPSVETMGIEELRSEVLALREHIRTLYTVWQEAEGDVELAARDGAGTMQDQVLERVHEWIAAGGVHDMQALVTLLENIPLPGDAP